MLPSVSVFGDWGVYFPLHLVLLSSHATLRVFGFHDYVLLSTVCLQIISSMLYDKPGVCISQTTASTHKSLPWWATQFWMQLGKDSATLSCACLPNYPLKWA